MVVLNMLCRTAWSSRVHKTERVSVTGHTWSAVCSTGSDHKQRDFCLHPTVLEQCTNTDCRAERTSTNRSLVFTSQQGRQPSGTCKPAHTFRTLFSAEWAANAVDLEDQR